MVLANLFDVKLDVKHFLAGIEKLYTKGWVDSFYDVFAGYSMYPNTGQAQYSNVESGLIIEWYYCVCLNRRKGRQKSN